MKRPVVYLDTSVLSAYFDERAPERQTLTQTFWKDRLPVFEGVISDLVLEEVRDTPDLDRRANLERLTGPLTVLPRAADSADLATEYVQRGVFSPADFNDALHLAVAATNDIRLLLSWNFRHLVRLSTRTQVNLVNSLLGFGPIEILAPPEL